MEEVVEVRRWVGAGGAWRCMEVHGYAWICMEVHGGAGGAGVQEVQEVHV